MNNITNFNEWIPEIYRVPIDEYDRVVENAVLTGQYGVYIPSGEKIHAYHGSYPIDRELCKELNVCVVDLGYNGGTLLGSHKDFTIIIVAPVDMGLNHELIINKYYEIISKYVPNTTIDRNDILIDGNKVCGSMERTIGVVYEWGAQVSFADYSEYISKICNKPQAKKPTYIDSNLLTRDKLEEEILAWLQKKEVAE
jgi:lipoate-protein ligase A